MRRFSMVAVAAVALATVPMTTQAAKALEPPLAFNSNSLSTWQTDGVVWALAQHEGTVFAGGTFSHIRPPGSPQGSDERDAVNFAAFNAATGAPTSCELSFTVGSGTATVRALDVSPDGETLYAGGYFSAVNGTPANSIAAIDIDTCSPVSGFRPAVSATVRAIDSSDDTVYFAGDFALVNGESRPRMAAVTSEGSLKSWTASADLPVRALALTPEADKVIVGGDFFEVNGADSHALAVLDAGSGDNHKTYPLGFIESRSVVKDITVDDSGFYTANEGTGGGVFDGRIALDLDDLEQRWRDTCLGANQSLAVYKGVLYSASHAHDCASMGAFPDGRRQHLLAQRTDDPKLLPWFPDTNDGIGEGIGPRDMVVSGGGPGSDYMWVAGEFTTVNGGSQQGLTRFGQGPDLAGPTTPVVSAASFEEGKAHVRWRASTDTDDGNLTYRVYRDGGSTPVWTGTAESRWWSRPQLSFTDTDVAPGTRHTYRVTASDGTNTSALSAVAAVDVASTTSPYPSRVLADGARLYWRYDEPSGTFAADSSPGNDNGFYSGELTRGAEGAIGDDSSEALGLDGSTGYLYTEQRHDRPTTFTVETWFKTTSTAGGKLVGFGNNQTRNSGSYDKHIYMTNDGRLVFGVWNGRADTITSGQPYNDGQWHQVAATQGPAGMALYVDGVRVARNGVTNSQDYSGFWRVGGDNLSGWPNRPTSGFFNGTLDETAVYPTALSGSKIADHYRLSGRTPDLPDVPSDAYGQAVYNDGPDSYWRLNEESGTTAADTSGNSAPGTYQSGVTRGTAGALDGTTDKAVTLSGTSSGLVTSATQGSVGPEYSAELWFKTDTTSGGKIIGFGSSQTGSSSNYDKHIYMANNGRLVFGVWNGHADTVISGQSYNDGQWHHLVATQGADGMGLYVDGDSVGTNPATTHQSFGGYWRVGGDNLNGWPNQPSSGYFKGSVDEVSIYSTRLSGSRISAHHSLGGDATDTQAPTTPTGLDAEVSDTDVALSWTASTDNVGVVGYAVHRSDTSGFTPSAGTRIGTVTSTSYTDVGRPAGTWYYRVVALDAEDNGSEPSAQVSVTIEAQPVTLTLTPEADTYVNQGAPSTNYGASGSLASRGSPGYTAYLRFAVPQAAAGLEVKSARLRIRTTGDTFAGSGDEHTVRVADDTWSESSVTWNTRPAADGPVLGTLSGASQPSTNYTVALEAEEVQKLLDDTSTLAVSSTGADNVWFASSNATAANRPQLVIELGPA